MKYTLIPKRVNSFRGWFLLNTVFANNYKKRFKHPILSSIFFPYLGLVPVFSLCDVLGGDGLVLRTNVSQSTGQIRLGHVHLDLHLSLLHLSLQLTNLLNRGIKWSVRFNKLSDITHNFAYLHLLLIIYRYTAPKVTLQSLERETASKLIYIFFLYLVDYVLTVYLVAYCGGRFISLILFIFSFLKILTLYDLT